jgi:hypothetical protein
MVDQRGTLLSYAIHLRNGKGDLSVRIPCSAAAAAAFYTMRITPSMPSPELMVRDRKSVVSEKALATCIP